MNNLKILSSEIIHKYDLVPTIAVIGNAGVNPEDEECINKADCIVHFNNYATRQDVRKKKDAHKCDILFSTFDLHSTGSCPRDVVITIPAPFHIKEIPTKINKWYPKSGHWMVNPYENMHLCEELGLKSLGYHHPLPTVGMTALYYLSKMPCRMFICGFSWYWNYQTGLFQGHHLSNKTYPSNWNHRYPAEIEWILNNLYDKPGMNFSQSCTSLLEEAKKQLGR